MKSLLLSLLLSLAPMPASAQPSCYMVASNGRMINLDRLCGIPATTQPTLSQARTTQGKRLTPDQIARVQLRYAQKYCDARFEGKAPRNAREIGVEAAVSLMFLVAEGVPDKADADAVFAGVGAAVAKECPKYN